MRRLGCAKAAQAYIRPAPAGPARSPAVDMRRGGRVAEGARLESVFMGNRNVGSNPTPSAKFKD